ncbi:hypothetical protein [Vibrio atlanticus]|uniref:hypothetical protein n=1 Tax=Vibrio atlanticus TaxID=693153 RepID=UPI00354C789F
MSKSQTTTLSAPYTGQREFQAKATGYVFDLLCDEWKIDYKKTIYLKWMHEKKFDDSTFIDLRLALANAAKFFAPTSIQTHCSRLKLISEHLDTNEFEAWWLTLSKNLKVSVKDTLAAITQHFPSVILQPLYEIVKNISTKKGGHTHAGLMLDSKKGSYSDIELDNIHEALRIESSKCLSEKIIGSIQFTNFRNTIMSQLLMAISRRPTQLRQIKWCDVLPVGTKFVSPKEKNDDWTPITQHLFSDVEQLHLRTFIGKDGEFRYNAESRSHRLEPKFSKLLLHYFRIYQDFLVQELYKNNLELTKDEIKEVMTCLPMFPVHRLFKANFNSKKAIFNSASITSQAYHLTSDNIQQGITSLFKKLSPKSDRHPSIGILLHNNRWRHTQLTRAARIGLSPALICNITGVTIEAIRPYLDLKVQERVTIDEAYAGNLIIQRFDSVSISELKDKSEFNINNEFDEEIGHKLNPENCSSCESKGGAPMACYPCSNFRPLETANHQQYLDKAKRKLKINRQSGHPATTRMLTKIILYITATIIECNERAKQKLGKKS